MRHLDTHTLWIQQAVRSRRLELRKVDGERNPADLLTKHNLSRGRMEMLVDLFGCKCIEGRAESAPLLRRGDSTRTTMAQVPKGLGTIRSGDADGHSPEDEKDRERMQPIMPHLMYSQAELDEQHPRLQAPEEEELDDFEGDTGDAVLQRGVALAREIQQQAAQAGRRRHPTEAPTSGSKPATASGGLNSVRLRAPRSAAGGVRGVGAQHDYHGRRKRCYPWDCQ